MKTTKQEYKIKHSLSVVASVLRRVEVFGHYHPLIKQVTVLVENELFQIKEQPFKFIPICFKYKCRTVVKTSEVQYFVSGIPIMNPYLYFKLEEISSTETLLKVYIRVASIPLISSVLLKMMFSAEDELWAAVNATPTKELSKYD